MARERERPRYDDCGDFGNRVSRDPGSGRACLSIPEGLQMWRSRKAGVYRVEFVPYITGKALEKFVPALRFCEPGKRWPERSYYVHAGIGVNNESHACLAKNLGQPCPICRYIETLRRSRHQEDIKLAKDLNPKLRQVWLLLDHAEPSKGLQLWDEANWNFGRHLLRKVNGADPDQVDRYRAFWHPIRGSTVKMIASEVPMGDGGRNNIEFTVDEFKPRVEDLDDAIFDHGYDLDRIINFLSYDQLEEVFNMKEGPAAKGDDRDREDRDRDDSRRETSSGGFALPGKRRETPKEEEPPPRRRAEPEPEEKPKSRREVEEEPPPRRRAAEPEPEPEPKGKAGKPKWKEGDSVKFTYRDKPYEGVIDTINEAKELAHIKVEGEEKLKAVDLDDLKPVEAKKPTKPLDDDPPPRRRAAEREAEEPPPRRRAAEPADDDPTPRRRTVEPEDDPPPRRKAEMDDDPPPRRRAAEPEPEAEPKAKAGKPKSTWDDEDDPPFKGKKREEADEPPARARR